DTAAGGVGAFISSSGKKEIEYGVVDYECGFAKTGSKVDVNSVSSCNLDHRKSFISGDDNRDNQLTAWLLNRISDSSTDVIMGVFDMIDGAGHSHGFDNNDKYLEAISAADVQVGSILNVIKERAALNNEEWLVVLTSDHGGHRFLAWGKHGKKKDQDEVIPFAVALYGSEQKLAALVYPVTHMDVHPTVMHWHNIAPTRVDGRVQGLQ
ncbi:MAG: alkaline phosphatase family protein, partial [Bdellovibrionota bacterium]